jgi:predicted RNase H-like nuclease (RuvC/YqgF family)
MADETTGKLELVGPVEDLLRALRAFNNVPEPSPHPSVDPMDTATYQTYLRQKDTIAQLVRDNSNLNAKIDLMTAEKRKLNAELVIARVEGAREITKLRTENDRLDKEVKELRVECRLWRETVDRKEDALTAKQKYVKKLEETLSRYEIGDGK